MNDQFAQPSHCCLLLEHSSNYKISKGSTGLILDQRANVASTRRVGFWETTHLPNFGLREGPRWAFSPET